MPRRPDERREVRRPGKVDPRLSVSIGLHENRGETVLSITPPQSKVTKIVRRKPRSK